MMNTIGFTRSTMPGETRVALLPKNVRTLRHPEQLFFEAGYAASLGIADEEYARLGAKVIPRSAMRHMDVICVPRFSQSDRALFQEGMTLWGWPYIEDNPWCARAVVEHALTVVDFHFMYSDGQFVFRENSRIAGRLGIMHVMAMGRTPERFGKTAVLGKGYLGSGAMGVLDGLRVRYKVFDRSNSCGFLRAVQDFDTIVNCIKWYAEGFFITREHIARMKEGAFIIDLSTEGIEDGVPQPAHAPVYRDGHVLKYCNDHIPAMWPALASAQISKALCPYIDMMVEGCPNPALEAATVATAGKANAATGELARRALERASSNHLETMQWTAAQSL
jgi:N5-(carboxyethyl)ornithine synthase